MLGGCIYGLAAVLLFKETYARSDIDTGVAGAAAAAITAPATGGSGTRPGGGGGAGSVQTGVGALGLAAATMRGDERSAGNSGVASTGSTAKSVRSRLYNGAI